MKLFRPVLASTFLFSFQTLAMSLGDCAKPIGYHTGISANGMGTHFGSPLSMKDNKIMVQDPKAIVSKEIRDDKEIYRYKVALTKDISEIRTLEISKDAAGNYKMVRKDDMKAQKEAAQKLGYYDSSMEKEPLRAGIEAHYSAKSGKCEVIQALNLKTQQGKELPKEVFIDKKYCDAIHDLMKSSGKNESQACVSILDKAQTIFNNRNHELVKESKSFTPFEHGFLGSALKLAYCSPQEYNLKLGGLNVMNRNSAYYNLTEGAGMNGPFDSSAPSMTQGESASGAGTE